MIQTRSFGRMPDGQEIMEYCLSHESGIELSFIPYGGIVTRLLVPDRRGKRKDVVLGCADLQAYLQPHPYVGALIGRMAGRLSGGQFDIDGKTYQLEINDPPNHLHGGVRGFDKQIWDVVALEDLPHQSCAALALTSPHGDQGYPGELHVRVTYTVTAESEWIIHYAATTDHPTPISLTSHSYFNLAGENSGSAEGHRLRIHADAITATDQHFTQLGFPQSLTPSNDFNASRVLQEAIPGLFRRHGDNCLIRGGGGSTPVPAASLEDPMSGRRLEVFSDAPCLQFYSGDSLDGRLLGKSGTPYVRHAGVCLECQHYPGGPDHPELGSFLLHPGMTYQQTTIHRFSHL